MSIRLRRFFLHREPENCRPFIQCWQLSPPTRQLPPATSKIYSWRAAKAEEAAD